MNGDGRPDDAQRVLPDPPRLRVLVVGSGWRFTSGISYYTWHLVAALHRHGHAVSAVLMRRLLPARLYPGRRRVGKPVTDQTYDPTIPVFDGIDWWGVPSLWRAVRFLRARRPEILVLEWWTATVLHSYLLLVLAARMVGAKVVVEFHEVLDTAELRIPFVSAYSRTVASFILRRANGAVVHSRHDLELLGSVYHLRDIPVVVAPHGPFDHLLGSAAAAASEITEPSRRTGGSDPEGRTDPDRDGDPLRLLYFGTIRPYKGVEYLVEAFNRLTAEQAQRLTLVVVGETWEGWTQPAELIASSPHRDRITFVNRYVEDAEVAAYFARADAVVLPYLRSSASGPLHLAMSHGLPLVVSDVGGLREAAEDYAGAIFVRPADVSALATSFDTLRARRGRRYADPHSWSRSVAAFEELALAMGVSGRVPPHADADGDAVSLAEERL